MTDPRNAEAEFNQPLSDRDLEEAVNSGVLSSEQASKLLQQAARRDTAEHGPSLDTDADGTITLGGAGSGQGMEKQRTGQ